MKIHSGSVDVSGVSGQDGIVILGTISEGRMFRTLKARHGTRYVALKAATEDNAMSVSLLRREYELCRDLSHPCVVSILGFKEDTPAGPAIEMEYISGRTLDEFVATAPSAAQRRAVLNDILDGMDYLHHRGILHNDLKPDNIVVNANGAARIIDFGLSVSEDSVYAGAVGGTCGYSAPEVLQGDGSAGAASDIYSLGLIINLLFGGRRYRRVARRCSRPEPAERFRNIPDLRKALAATDRRPFIWTGAGALLLVLSAVVYALDVKNRNAGEQIETFSKQVLEETGQMYRNAVDEMKTTVDSRMQQKADDETARFERQKKMTEAEIAWFFQEALDSIGSSPDQKTARTAYALYIRRLSAYQDSILKMYPMTQLEMALEARAALGVCKEHLDSVVSLFFSLPVELPNYELENLKKAAACDMERLKRQVWADVQAEKEKDTYMNAWDLYDALSTNGRVDAYVDSVKNLYPTLERNQINNEVMRLWIPYYNAIEDSLDVYAEAAESR